MKASKEQVVEHMAEKAAAIIHHMMFKLNTVPIAIIHMDANDMLHCASIVDADIMPRELFEHIIERFKDSNAVRFNKIAIKTGDDFKEQ